MPWVFLGEDPSRMFEEMVGNEVEDRELCSNQPLKKYEPEI
jgi:hypothetical protein